MEVSVHLIDDTQNAFEVQPHREVMLAKLTCVLYLSQMLLSLFHTFLLFISGFYDEICKQQ